MLAVYLVIALVGGVLAWLIAANRNVPNPGVYFFIGLILPLIGVVIACVVKPGGPSGTRSLDCPRCNARQNVPFEAQEWSCWQCGLPGHVAA